MITIAWGGVAPSVSFWLLPVRASGIPDALLDSRHLLLRAHSRSSLANQDMARFHARWGRQGGT